MFAGLLSRGAHDLYDRLVTSGGLPMDGPSGILEHQVTALEELSSHGLLWESAGPPRHVRAVSQPVALRRLIGARQRELAEAHRQLADDYLRLEQWESRAPLTPVPRSSGVELVPGPDQVLARLHDLLAGARRECRILGSDEHHGLLSDGIALRSTARETVRFRAILTPPALRHETAYTGGGRPADDSQVRLLPALPAPLALIDDTALMPIGTLSGAALVIHVPALVEALSSYFEMLWPTAAPLGQDRPAPADSPGPIELQILRLAATGLKDEAIARSLGRSSRWVRRHFEALEERLGATNRLTLGIAAARRGWV